MPMVMRHACEARNADCGYELGEGDRPMASPAEQSADPFYQSKRRTWGAFKHLVLWVSGFIALILALMAIFLV